MAEIKMFDRTVIHPDFYIKGKPVPVGTKIKLTKEQCAAYASKVCEGDVPGVVTDNSGADEIAALKAELAESNSKLGEANAKLELVPGAIEELQGKLEAAEKANKKGR